jgi:hypothetical protein
LDNLSGCEVKAAVDRALDAAAGAEMRHPWRKNAPLRSWVTHSCDTKFQVVSGDQAIKQTAAGLQHLEDCIS